jgi:hypothetical protein
MKIPKSGLADWSKEIIDECMVSRETRIDTYRRWKNIFYTGSDNGVPSKRNRCFSHVDKLSSYLFSPADVFFNVEFDDDSQGKWTSMAERASNYLNRQFSRRGCDVVFSQANEWSLVKGATLVKMVWSRGGFEPWVIQPEFFGVLREDIEDLDRQDAFVHTFYQTPTQFRRLLGNHPDKTRIMAEVGASFAVRAAEDNETGFRDISSGGGFPLAVIGVPGVTTPSTQTFGNVDWTTAQEGAMLAPDVISKLIQVYDLWVWNDDLEDWSTIRYVEPGVIIEGKYQLRNLSDIPKEHPFVKVCSNTVPGYFWGRSEIANVWQNQRLLTNRLNNADRIYNQQAQPARSVIGGTGITDEKVRALLSPAGVLTDPSPTAKVETYKPDMPQGFMDFIKYLDDAFDEVAGFTAITSGQGEPGVRAGTHANTLLRTSTPRLRDRALLVEKQAAAFGGICLKMLRAKDASVLITEDGQQFLLDQLPEDASVVVDSHTSSPAFSGDNENKLFALSKVGAIDNESLLEGTHPPRQEQLIARLRKKEKAQAAQMEELKKTDPTQWAKAIGGGGRHR